ncbi:hypothetical protein [Pseudomonas sp. FP2254]|uniref:hypothetical protein n=1 Tax=Pseudomonas sp. FP2254 TaxID=2954087 RepID=UPI002733AC17|nr:hypothetical protein [Pseudomonas sp. FP2254]WLH42096.1 hypothetical protein PSH94_05905 [Pseudomonas sp. FP2254]
MSLSSIALWLGYGSMIVGAVLLITSMLFVVGCALAAVANKNLRALIRIYDLKTLRATMRQLEAEGKVSKKTGAQS